MHVQGKSMVNKNIIILFPLLLWNANRTTSRFEAHLVYKHTQKPNFLISNALSYSRFYGKKTSWKFIFNKGPSIKKMDFFKNLKINFQHVPITHKVKSRFPPMTHYFSKVALNSRFLPQTIFYCWNWYKLNLDKQSYIHSDP